MPDEGLNIRQIQSAIDRQGGGWVAAENNITRLTEEQRARLLGAVPDPSEGTLEEIAARAASQKAMISAAALESAGAPASFDWRNSGGRNYTTSVKNQGGCGSCVAFGCSAVIETTFKVQRGNPAMAIDLSEAHLFFCHGRAAGRNCSNGWLPDPALAACRDVGIVDEACYPYVGTDQNCSNRCADWQNRLTKIRAITNPNGNPAAMKTWLSTRGSLTGCFTVYNDFFAYRSGVYRHTSGALAGGHCVEIIGYDDAQQCWICKNSWGAAWGDQGFFRIAYGECGIDTWHVRGVDGIAETGWLANGRVLGLWSNDSDRNAYAYTSRTSAGGASRTTTTTSSSTC